MNILDLAVLELRIEGKDEENVVEILNYAQRIRKWIDRHGEAVTKRIMQGHTIYKKGNKIRTYAKVI
jgi:hypothetical protein